MNNYVQVGSIIEKERLARQNQISKGIIADKCETIANDFEKAVKDDLNETISCGSLLPEVVEFSKSIRDNNLSKADVDIYLHKVQRELTADSNSVKLNQLKQVLIDYRSEL